MGIRGEIFSTRISCEGRTYFFNVKENRMGDVFLTIVESKPTDTETFDRRSIVVFREDMRGFLKAFQTTLNYLEKPGRESQAMSFEPPDGAPKRYKRPLTQAEAEAAALASSESASGEPGETGIAPTPKVKRRVVVKKKTPKGPSPEALGEAD